MPAASNRRMFTRVPIHLPATVHYEGGVYTAVVCDVSLGGLFLRCDAKLGAGDACVVEIGLDAGPTIKLRSQVVRSTGGGVALVVQGSDAASCLHLFQLVRHNTEDPDAIATEIAEWLRSEAPRPPTAHHSQAPRESAAPPEG